jgi:hypothetical protein
VIYGGRFGHPDCVCLIMALKSWWCGCARRFDQHAGGLSGAVQRMSELLLQPPEVPVSTADAPSPVYIPPLGDDLADAGEAREEEGSSCSSGTGAGSGGDSKDEGALAAPTQPGPASNNCSSSTTSPFTQLLAAAPPIPLSMKVVHTVLQQLYGAAVDLRSQRDELLRQVGPDSGAALCKVGRGRFGLWGASRSSDTSLWPWLRGVFT